MKVKSLIKDLVALVKLNQQLNTIVDDEIKAAKKKVKETENKPKILGI